MASLIPSWGWKLLRLRPQFLKDNAEIFKSVQYGDNVIAIMGPTGSGKSTFINKLLNREEATVAHGLESCTEKLEPFEVKPNEINSIITGRLFILDTPGFGDSRNVTDGEVLKLISHWLANSYHSSIKLTGLIYLHDMTAPRMYTHFINNLDMFRQLCGDDGMPAVTFMTTKWELVDSKIATAREKDLKNKFLQKMHDAGATYTQLKVLNQESAREVIDSIIVKRDSSGRNDCILQIQRELVDFYSPLSQTAAGRVLRQRLQTSLDTLMKEAATPEGSNPDLQKEIQEILQEIAAFTRGSFPAERLMDLSKLAFSRPRVQKGT